MLVNFFQIAETSNERAAISSPSTEVHRYPYKLLFPGALDSVNRLDLYVKVLSATLFSRSKIILLAGYDTPVYWFQLFIAKLKGQVVAVSCDSTRFDNPKKVWKTWAKMIFFGQVDHVMCYGVRSKEYVMLFGVRDGQITVGCQACRLPEGYSSGQVLLDKKIARSKDLNKLKILFVGRLSKEKDIYTLLAAFKQVHDRYCDAELTIVGSGAEEDSLKKFSQSIGVVGSVTFSGSKQGVQLYECYTENSLLVLPSFERALGAGCKRGLGLWLSRGC